MGDGAQHVFRFNEEALSRENIKLAIVDEANRLDFVHRDDTVISRTFNRTLIERIRDTGARNTAEKYSAYDLVRDKVALSYYLRKNGILVPGNYTIEQVVDGNAYFVKPRFGQDSFGITIDCICKSRNDVIHQVKRIGNELHQDSAIEDFIDGEEITVSCVNNGGMIRAYAVKVDCSKRGGIQTRDCKLHYDEYCSPIYDNNLEKNALAIFSLLELKHIARMDFRKGMDGRYYLIDINLLPGLGPIDHYAKSLLLAGNISYIDAMKSIVNSATLD